MGAFQGIQVDPAQNQTSAVNNTPYPTEPPKSQMQFTMQKPGEAPSQFITRNQRIADTPNMYFNNGTPTQQVENPEWVKYQNKVQDYDFAKKQFDRDYALDNARLASEWAANKPKPSMMINQGLGTLPIFGQLFSQVMPAQPAGPTEQEVSYKAMQQRYADNPLVAPQPIQPANVGYNPLATTPILNYGFGTVKNYG